VVKKGKPYSRLRKKKSGGLSLKRTKKGEMSEKKSGKEQLNHSYPKDERRRSSIKEGKLSSGTKNQKVGQSGHGSGKKRGEERGRVQCSRRKEKSMSLHLI